MRPGGEGKAGAPWPGVASAVLAGSGAQIPVGLEACRRL